MFVSFSKCRYFMDIDAVWDRLGHPQQVQKNKLFCSKLKSLLVPRLPRSILITYYRGGLEKMKENAPSTWQFSYFYTGNGTVGDETAVLAAFVLGWIFKSGVLTHFLQHPWAVSSQLKLKKKKKVFSF